MLKIIIYLIFVYSCCGSQVVQDLTEDAAKYLLPGNIVPIHYNLTVTTHIEHFHLVPSGAYEFLGFVEITVEALEDNIANIILHSYDDMVIVEANIYSVQPDGVDRILNVGIYDNETNKQTLITYPPLLQHELYVISLNYTGKNTHDQTGFYRAGYYVGLDRRWLVVTDFEPSSARRGFPCFDEPKYKATFQLTLDFNETLIEEGYVAHHNTEIESETVRDGRHLTTFKKTPLRISTYMVAFMISDFLSSPNTTYFNSSYAGENGIKPFNTLGRPNYINLQRDLTSQVAGPAVMNIMTKKTGVGFGYDKIEQTGIPDFGPGLTENWGLITYRENYIYWDENGTSFEMQDVVKYTAHELSNQWFGDLVTLHWWSDLWLNDGFATFFEYHAADEIREPNLDTSTWNLIGSYMNYVVQYGAFYADALSFSRPLTFEAYDKETIDDFFDHISSYKGAAVIRMIMHIVGEEIFYAGLNRYLKSQSEDVGTPEILFASWDDAIKDLPENEQPDLPASISVMFKNWHIQAGYPLLTVTRDGADLTIKQQHYMLNSNTSTNRWYIPLSYSTDLEYNFNDTRPIAFFTDSETTTNMSIKNANASWFVLNNQVAGYYRINYDERNWDALLAVIHNSSTINQIHEFNRAQITHDSSTIAKSSVHDYLHYRVFFSLLASLRHDRSIVVWTVAYNEMNYMLTHTEDFPETHTLLMKYFGWIVKPAFEELTLYVSESDTHTKKLLRVFVSKLACKLEVEGCLEQVSDLFYTRSYHPDVRRFVLCEGVRHGLEPWENILEEALASEGFFRTDLLTALTCSDNEVILKRLAVIMTNEELSNADKYEVISAAAEQGPKQAMFALDVLLQLKFKRAENILKEIGQRLSSMESAQMMELLSQREATYIRLNREWKENKHQSIQQWLKTNNYY